MNKSFVYWIYNKDCGLIETTGYIGVSINPEFRLRRHLWDERVPFDCVVSILFEGTRDECFEKELEMRPEPGIGWNVARGGEQGYRFGIPRTDETKMKISQANKGLKRTDATRKKMSEASIGREFSKETRDKLSKANMGKIMPNEIREKISQANKGLKRTDATRKKMSESKKGSKHPNFKKPAYNRIDFYCIKCKEKTTPYKSTRYHQTCFKINLKIHQRWVESLNK